MTNAIIDELKIFNRALSESDILFDFRNQMYQSTSQSCSSSLINPNYRSVNGLVNYWTFCANFDDSIGQAKLFGASNAALVSDRFGVADSALNLANGFIQVPTGVYFNGNYTVTAWVNI